MKNPDCVRLLIAEKSTADAESLAKVLRAAGHCIEVDYAGNAAAFESALLAGLPDIVVCGSGGLAPDAAAVMAILGQHQLSPPVVAIVEQATGAAAVAAATSGIAALVPGYRPELFQLVMSREIKLLHLQQRLAGLAAALNDCEERCTGLIESSGDAIACVRAGMHIFANQAYLDLFGIGNHEELAATPLIDLVSTAQRDTFEAFLRDFGGSENTKHSAEIDCANHQRADFSAVMEFTHACIGGDPCVQILIRNTSSLELDRRTQMMARLDTLTGLYNRQYFMELLEDDINTGEEDGDARALLYITLDGFKEFREENGIAASDIVLCELARLLEKQSGKRDSIARFGDCSFTLLHHDGTTEEIQAMGEKLLRDITAHIAGIKGQGGMMSCSIGICAINERSTGSQTILGHADTACEVARSAGGNRIHTHSSVIDEQLSEGHEGEWDKVIRKTIDEERFYLAYQPIISLNGNTGKRFEALLRIIDEEGHTILPGQFLAIAEKSGFSSEIDYWIFETAFRTISGLRADGEDITLFLKLGRSVLADAGLPVWILNKLKEYRLASDSVVFEIQEAVAINDLRSAITFVRAMKNLQCKVVLEHFGMNNQPQLLKHVPADMLKIDGSLTENLATDKEHQSRVRALIRFAHDLGIPCIAERIDNPASLAFLWQYGIDLVQGNFIHVPSRALDYDFDCEIA